MASSAAKRARGTAPLSARIAIRYRIPKLRFEQRLAGLLLAFALLAAALGCSVLYLVHASLMVWMCALALLFFLILFLSVTVFRHVVRPLQTLSNVVLAMRQNEYSFRARETSHGDALGDLAAQINELASDLRSRRHHEIETFALLERVVETMNLPVFAFDPASNLQLTNPAALNMLHLPADSALHQSAQALGLGEILDCADNSVVALAMHGRDSRWMVRQSKIYQNGVPHTLLMLSDVSGVLREQERQAWQRLIRVLAHEVNNSLTPIKSIAGSLRLRMQGQKPGDFENMRLPEHPKQTVNLVEIERGLAVVEERAESLNRFLQAYTQLAKLPPPVKTTFAVASLLERVCHLETRLKVLLNVSADLNIYADPAQLEQALINVIRNAVDAAMQAHNDGSRAQVALLCQPRSDSVVIQVEDNGDGLANPANLFVPFYTTKPGGTGIGLILALQIVEAHGGTLVLTNRNNAPGCCAEIHLPIRSKMSS